MKVPYLEVFVTDLRRPTDGLTAFQHLPPLQTGRLQDSIYNSLRGGIMGGLLAPGSHLRQVELANHFGTSQAPVREALQRLTQEGLVVTMAHKGSFVAQLSMTEVEEVYSLRAELESWAVRRLVTRLTDQHIAALRQQISDMDRAAEVDDGPAVSEADARFHAVICRGAESTLLLQVWEPMDSRVRGMMSIANALFDKGLATVGPSHYPIVEALERRDTDLAVQRIHEHMQNAWQRIEVSLGADAS
jgi:DNA-binding GntR family transcriptional regulator